MVDTNFDYNSISVKENEDKRKILALNNELGNYYILF